TGTQNFNNTLTASGATFNFGSSTVNVANTLSISAGAFTSTSGNLNLSGGLLVSGSPTFTHNSGTVRFLATQSITPSSIVFNNVTVQGTNATFTLVGTMAVSGNLILGDTATGNINGGTIAVDGNVTYNNSGYVGTAFMIFGGSTSSTLSTSTTNILRGNVTVNKLAGASLTLGSIINLNGTGQTLEVLEGSILMSGRNLTVQSDLLLSPGTTVNRGGAVLTANGSTINAGTCCGGGNVL
ncbi:MAG: hypothetical protein ACK5WZ_00740, partial [Pseudobdellovibrionaceae bacterium]